MNPDEDKKVIEMARESYLMRREIAIIAAIFFLFVVVIFIFSLGLVTQVRLPY